MAVTVTLSTTLRDHVPGYTPAVGLAFDLAALSRDRGGAPTGGVKGGEVNAGDLAAHMGLPLSDIKIIMINGRHASLDQLVRDGDRVAYFPAVGGG